jgi:hypothetical protein
MPADLNQELEGTQHKEWVSVEIDPEYLASCGMEPFDCQCTEGPHDGGLSQYIIVHPSVRSRPMRPCKAHLAGYLRGAWFVRTLPAPPDTSKKGAPDAR